MQDSGGSRTPGRDCCNRIEMLASVHNSVQADCLPAHSSVPRPGHRTGHTLQARDQANASTGGQAHTRFRSPYAWSIRRTGGQYFRALMPGSGYTACSRV